MERQVGLPTLELNVAVMSFCAARSTPASMLARACWYRFPEKMAPAKSGWVRVAAYAAGAGGRPEIRLPRTATAVRIMEVAMRGRVTASPLFRFRARGRGRALGRRDLSRAENRSLERPLGVLCPVDALEPEFPIGADSNRHELLESALKIHADGPVRVMHLDESRRRMFEPLPLLIRKLVPLFARGHAQLAGFRINPDHHAAHGGTLGRVRWTSPVRSCSGVDGPGARARGVGFLNAARRRRGRRGRRIRGAHTLELRGGGARGLAR